MPHIIRASLDWENRNVFPCSPSQHCYAVILHLLLLNLLGFRNPNGPCIRTFLHQLLTDDRATVRQALMPRNPGPVGGVSATTHEVITLLLCKPQTEMPCLRDAFMHRVTDAVGRPQRVPEGTRLLDFQITTRTLLGKFYYSTE